MFPFKKDEKMAYTLLFEMIFNPKIDFFFFCKKFKKGFDSDIYSILVLWIGMELPLINKN